MPPQTNTAVVGAADAAVAPKSDANLKKFTWRELAKHNTAESAYVAVRGYVYDVTQWMKSHPGGADVLLVAAGRDCTQVFDMYHQLNTHEVLPKYLIGVLVDNELPVFPPPSEFHRTVKKRVYDYLKANKLHPKRAPAMWGRYAGIYIGLFASWYLQMVFAPHSLLLASVMAILLGWCCALVGLMPLHDGSHFAITRNPLVWRLLGATHDFFNGSSYLIWMYQHMLGHHAYTNIDGADPDIDTLPDGDIRRIKQSQKWYSRYITQHIYVPLVYALLGLKTRYQDIVILHFLKTDGAIRVNPPTWYHLFAFWAGKLFFVFYRFYIPLQFLPWTQVIGLFLLADAMSSYWLALLFQANHVAVEVNWPIPDKENRIHQDWAEMQIQTTQDYGHGSWFWTVFSGSLNYQTTHHLFPNVNQYYYPVIAPIIAKTCKEFGLTYLVKDTVVEAVGSHLTHLYNMGHPVKQE